MAIPLALMAGGTALSIYGNIKANRDEASAIGRNIRWMEAQRSFMRRAQEREESLFNSQTEAVVGAQASIAGAAGLELSGTVFDVMNGTYAEAEREIAAIRDNARMQEIQMNFQMHEMSHEAKKLKSFSHNFMQSATIGLNAAGGMAQAGTLPSFNRSPSSSFTGTGGAAGSGGAMRAPSSMPSLTGAL